MWIGWDPVVKKFEERMISIVSPPSRPSPLTQVLLVLLVLVLASGITTAAIYDGNANGVSDVWEARYGIANPSVGADADGDGQSDLEEGQNGTNPWDADSTLVLSISEAVLAKPFVSWESKEGKLYQVEGLNPEGGWEALGSEVIGSGASVGFSHEDYLPSGVMAYRVLVVGEEALRPEIEETLGLIDTDGDGQDDWTEWQAGSSLIDPAEQFGIGTVGFQNAVILSWPTVAGMRYRVESMDGGPWEEVEGVFRGNGGLQRVAVEYPGTTEMFRLVVEAPDSDGDGLTDWEEELAGLDPQHPNSREVERTDLEVVIDELGQGGEITLEACEPVLNLALGGEGAVRVRREGGFRELTVPLVVGGNAVGGVDYEALPGSVTLPFGVNELEIPVRLLGGPPPSETKHVEMALGGAAGYQLGGVVERSVTLLKENLINVHDYGALGDGVADDGAAIQAAINALESSSTFNGLYFPAGTYRLKTLIGTVNAFRLLELGNQDLAGRDIVLKGEAGAVLYSDVGFYRASMLLCKAGFRTLSARDLRFEQSPTPLWPTPNYEPNGSDGVTVSLKDGRRVEKVSFEDCEFINCHRSVSINGRGYDVRGLCGVAEFEGCQFLNPYGANTSNGGTAWGGGQQVYMTAWVAEARYRNCLFDGGSEDMTDASTAPGGHLKDGGHFGYPLRLDFRDNIVRRMGIEAIFQINFTTLMGATVTSFTVPPADDVTEATLTVDTTPSTYVPGETIVIRTPLTPGMSPSNNLFTIRAFDPGSRELRISNPGHPGNLTAGSTIATGRTIYLDERSEATIAHIEGNLLEGSVPPGGVAGATRSGISYAARATIVRNLIKDHGWGIYGQEEVISIQHPSGRGSVLRGNVVITSDSRIYDQVFTYGITVAGS